MNSIPIDRRRFIELASARGTRTGRLQAPRRRNPFRASRSPRRAVSPGRRHRRHRARRSAKLSAIWGQQMVDENKGGGGDLDRTDTVARPTRTATPCCCNRCRSAVNKYLFATLPFDPVADLAPVSLICDYPNRRCRADVVAGPFGAGFIAYARANPARRTNASSGHGTSVHSSASCSTR
jgi:hypothetical protein